MYNLAIRELNNLVIPEQDSNAVSDDRVDYELTMQNLAGEESSTDFQTVRDSLAVRQKEEDQQFDLDYVEAAFRSNRMTPEVAQNIVQHVYRLSPETSLERAAGTGVATTALGQNPDQAQIAYADGDGFIEDMSRKNTAIIGLIQNLREYSQNAQGWLGDTMDFARTVVDPGFHQLGVASGYSKTLVGEDESLLKTSGGLSKQIGARLTAMRTVLSAPEFEEAMSQVYQEITSANPNTWILDDLIDAIEGGNNLTDMLGAVEVAGIGKGVAKAAIKGFNKAAMINLAKETVKNGTNAEKLAETLPTVAKPIEQVATTSTHSVAKYDIPEEIIKEAQEAMLVEGLEEGEKKALIDSLRKEVNKTWGMSSDEPVDISAEFFDDHSALVTYRVGNAGQGMAVEQATKRQAQLAKKGVEAEVVRTDGTGAYLEIKQAVDAKTSDSFIQNVNGSAEWTVEDGVLSGMTNWFKRMFAGSTNLSEVAHAKDIQASRVHSQLYNKYYATKKATYDRLDEYQKTLIETVHKEGKNKGVWFDDNQLRNFGLNDEAVEAYHAYKNMEDLTYVMDNFRTVRNLKREGYKTYGTNYIGKEVPSVSLDVNKISIIGEDGQLLNKADVLQQANEFTFIKLKEGLNNADATHLALRKSAAEARELPQFVTPYLAGGRRQYLKGTQFVRVLGHVKDELGHKVAQRVRVLTTARTAEDAAKCVEEIQSVINIIKEVGKDSLEGTRRLSQLDLQHFRVNNWDQVKEMMDKGILDADSQVKFMTHGKKFIPDSDELLGDTDDFALDLLKVREKFNTHRGNLLDDVFGNDALTYGMDDMFNKAIARAASLGARGDLLDWYKKALMPYINKGMLKNGERLKQLDPEQLIKEAVTVDRKQIAGTDVVDFRAAENMLAHAKRIANARTPGDTAIERFMTSLAEKIYPTASKIMSPEKASNLTAWLESLNPVKAAQALSFQAYMGWWNPAQLYKQAMGTANVLFLEPIKGSQAAIAYPLVRLARATAHLPNIQKQYLKGIKKITGMDDDAVQGLFKYMDRHATEFSSGVFIGAEDYQRALLRDKDSLMNRFWQSQYFFMREGNAANYYVADIAAYLAKHNKGHRAVAAYADDLFLNMTRASASEMQTGVTSLFTQWLTYPMRAIEAMGNKRLSKVQRASLLVGNLGLYGAGGTLGLNLYSSLTNKDVTPEVGNIIQSGIMGALGKEMGINLDEGIGVYEMIKNVTAIYSLAEGEFTLPPVSAGAGIAIWGNLFNYLGKLTKTAATSLTLDDLARDIAEEKFLPSSLKNSAKALIGFRYNKLINSRGVVAEDPTTAQKVFQALGFQPYEAKAIREMQTAIMDQDKTVKEHIESAKEYIRAVNRYNTYSIESDDNFYRLVREEDRIIAELEQNLVDTFGEDSSAIKDFRKGIRREQLGELRYLEDETLLKGSKKLPSARFEAIKYLYNLGDK